MHKYLGFLLTSQCQFASSELYWMKNEVLAISLQYWDKNIYYTWLLWPYGVCTCWFNSWVSKGLVACWWSLEFWDQNQLFLVFNAPSQLILFQISAAMCTLPTLGVLCDVDSFWVFHPYSFY